MPIKPIDAPDTQGAFEVVQQALTSRALISSFSLPRLSRADPRTLWIALPHRVEFLALGDLRRDGIRRDRVRNDEKADCWRFLVLQEREPIAAATAFRADDGRFAFGDLNEGPFVKATADAIVRAEALAEVREGQFEAALLVVPALYVLALWLQSLPRQSADGRPGEADLLIALRSSNPALDPEEAMAPAPFFEALSRQAR